MVDNKTDQKALFIQWVEDLEIQGHIPTDKKDAIILAVLKGEYDEILDKKGGIFWSTLNIQEVLTDVQTSSTLRN